MPNGKMSADRLTAFTDGVFAVIVTIMVLELKAPDGHVSLAVRKVRRGTHPVNHARSFKDRSPRRPAVCSSRSTRSRVPVDRADQDRN
ncbi:TMEM175 family protein [Paraburkholderia kirstenboschensis]|uniref:TMEM175 family protein n=1 Tax=Paraburkholderia kirstenboschensis TaxID=1245436 RepID=UPI002E2A3564|nr:TMEM175 family protein [Paraburkholderia kirstenboschensis]